ncbi:MAG TPA: MarR family winged helix-turn-helix transcriptional regulator [Anaerolineaceae bacterium]
MTEAELAQNLLNWSNTFLHLSLQDFNRCTRTVGLSLVQMTVLMHLHYRGPSEVTRLCEILQVTPAGASQMVERMVQQEVVRRVEAPGDRRIRRVELTDAGRQLVLDCISTRETWVNRLVAALPEAERECVAAAFAVLNQYAARFELPEAANPLPAPK